MDGGRQAGHVYHELVAAQLAEERATKASLEDRGARVVTWSGALVAASLALLAIVASNGVAAAAVLAAAVLLTLAALAGAETLRPREYEEADADKLREVIETPSFMEAAEAVGLARAAGLMLTIRNTARDRNETKARWLKAALWLLIGGAAALTVAAGAVAVPVITAGS